MIHDAWIVSRQEWCTIRRSLLPSLGAILTLLATLVLFGIVIPIGHSRGWLNAVANQALWFWLIWLLVAGPISDSFAGERERHSLETLFSTRLPEIAILGGKIVAVAAYGWLVALFALFASAAIAYVLDAGEPVMTTMSVSFVAVVLTPLAALLASSTGALISLQARNARQAHQATIAVVPILALAGLAAHFLVDEGAPCLVASISADILTYCTRAQIWIAVAVLMALLTAFVFGGAYVCVRRCRTLPA